MEIVALLFSLLLCHFTNDKNVHFRDWKTVQETTWNVCMKIHDERHFQGKTSKAQHSPLFHVLLYASACFVKYIFVPCNIWATLTFSKIAWITVMMTMMMMIAMPMRNVPSLIHIRMHRGKYTTTSHQMKIVRRPWCDSFRIIIIKMKENLMLTEVS